MQIYPRNEVSTVFQVFFLFSSATKLYCQNLASYWFSVGNQINWQTCLSHSMPLRRSKQENFSPFFPVTSPSDLLLKSFRNISKKESGLTFHSNMIATCLEDCNIPWRFIKLPYILAIDFKQNHVLCSGYYYSALRELSKYTENFGNILNCILKHYFTEN